MKTKIFNTMLCLFTIVATTACKKDWLDKKPDSKLSTAETLEDFQLIMDDRGNFNVSGYYPLLGANDFYITETNLLSLSSDRTQIDNYTWSAGDFVKGFDSSWDNPYNLIFKCNYILNALDKLADEKKGAALFNQVKGTALFWRANHYFDLVQSFCKPYDGSKAINDAGVPLRLEANISQQIGRGNLKQVYDQILIDLNEAAKLLPNAIQPFKTRPAKVAAYSLLSRIYLSMDNFTLALEAAEAALQINSQLLDYNSITVSASATMSMSNFSLNPEVNYSINNVPITTLGNGLMRVDPDLYNSYNANDLRKSLFFRLREPNAYSFRGTYNGTSVDRYFTSVAVDELYLIKAECLARKGGVTEAMSTLNTLLENRWIKNKFVPFTAANADDALRIILRERRKELVYRSTQWMDMRRLNKYPEFATTVTRVALGVIYTLSPGSNLYAWPIPRSEVQYSGIAQNPRD